MCILTLLVTLALGACGGTDPAPPAAPQPTGGQGGGGRAIGAPQDPERKAVGAAVAFVRGYLAWQAGELDRPEEIPNVGADLAEAIGRARVPPAQRERDSTITAARLERIDGQSARVTVQVTNRDEDLTYPLPIDLQPADGGRWIVLAAGTDR